MALLLPPSALFPALFALTASALILLAMTPGFRWASCGAAGAGSTGRVSALVGVGTAAVCAAAVWLLVPEQALRLPRTNARALADDPAALPDPVGAAAGDHLPAAVLSPLRRRCSRGVGAAVAANAVAFGFAHLMFWNWVAVGLSGAGGLIFALGYLNRGGFPTAVVLHAVCGGIVFTSGLGAFFYHGAVPLR